MFCINQESDRQRVAITGMGIVTKLGESLSEYFASLSAGRSGISYWKNKDDRIYSKFGGDMSEFDFAGHFDRVGKKYPSDIVERARKLLRPTPLSGCLTACAAAQAFVDAGLPEAQFPPERFGHIVGGHNLSGSYSFANTLEFNQEPDFIEPLYGLVALDTDVLAVTSEILTLKGPSYTLGGACASSNIALQSAVDLIRSGRADAMLVSGGVMELSPLWLQGWTFLEAISYQSFNEEPSRASRPFDKLREGFVPSEGTGAVAIETLASARARGARIYAEILGISATSDGSRQTKPNLEGQVRAMTSALQEARIETSQVDYINAHGTSTVLGDISEVAAIKKVFGDRAYQIPINSTKSMLGHCLHSSSIVELIATILQMKNSIVHPTINLEEPDPELDLDFVPNHAREHKINFAISNSFGFGGFNSSVALANAA